AEENVRRVEIEELLLLLPCKPQRNRVIGYDQVVGQILFFVDGVDELPFQPESFTEQPQLAVQIFRIVQVVDVVGTEQLKEQFVDASYARAAFAPEFGDQFGQTGFDNRPNRLHIFHIESRVERMKSFEQRYRLIEHRFGASVDTGLRSGDCAQLGCDGVTSRRPLPRDMSFDLFDRKRLIERGDETLRVGRARPPAQHFAQRAVNYLSELRRSRRAWRTRTRRAPRTNFFGQDCETLYVFQQFFLGHRFTPSNLVALSACLTRGSRSVPFFRPIVLNKRELFRFVYRRRRFGVRDHPFRDLLPALKERLLGVEQLPLAAIQRLPDQVGPRLPFAATFTPEADDVVNRRVTNHLGKDP